MGMLRWVQRKAMMMIGGLEHLPYEERLRACLGSLIQKRMLGKDLIADF